MMGPLLRNADTIIRQRIGNAQSDGRDRQVPVWSRRIVPFNIMAHMTVHAVNVGECVQFIPLNDAC